MEYVLAGMIGYLLGSVPVAALVARRHGVDIHAAGDGNPGAWNALEQLGARRAWPVFAGDALKGALAGADRGEQPWALLQRRRGGGDRPVEREQAARADRGAGEDGHRPVMLGPLAGAGIGQRVRTAPRAV